ncbi:MAG TPA: hypothetical protein VE093_10055 [Polyangiaceae bacterium]|nr:hypothetical protein [Polyangiaceae bacterium]
MLTIRSKLQWESAAIDLDFKIELSDVEDGEFYCDVNRLLSADSAEDQWLDVRWGRLHASRLERRIRFPPTRLYSPDFLERVFGWSQEYKSSRRHSSRSSSIVVVGAPAAISVSEVSRTAWSSRRLSGLISSPAPLKGVAPGREDVKPPQ